MFTPEVKTHSGATNTGYPSAYPALDESVRMEFLHPEQKLPLVISPNVENLSLIEWAASNRAVLDDELAVYGGILFRGFDLEGASSFEQLIVAISESTLEYKERSSPRSQIEGNIYTSTDYPAEQPIFLHNENSYQQVWPMKIFFCCMLPAEQGGATPIADCRKIYQQIDPAIRRKFLEKKWCYVRNFEDGFGLSWKTVFQTSSKAEVEEYCRRKGIEFEWIGNDCLRTRAVRPAAVRHPRTEEPVWFNHATFFHITTLDEATREVLLDEFEEVELPTNTYFGDGSRIEEAALDQLREVYRRETVSFPWQSGDVLMLDNMMVAHGRAPFSGPRKVAVGMAEPCSWDQVSTNGLD